MRVRKTVEETVGRTRVGEYSYTLKYIAVVLTIMAIMEMIDLFHWFGN